MGSFTSPEIQESHRLYEWSKSTQDGEPSDFEIEPDAKSGPRSARSSVSLAQALRPAVGFWQGARPLLFQRARSRILSTDVLVLNHTLFFMHLGGLEETVKGGVCSRTIS